MNNYYNTKTYFWNLTQKGKDKIQKVLLKNDYKYIKK